MNDVIVNLEAEQAILGAVLMNNRVWDRVAGTLRPTDFADAVHGRIWTAIATLLQSGSVANILTLKALADSDANLVDDRGNPLGGAYLASLANAVVTFVGLEDYARVVRDLAERRRIVRLANEAIINARNVTLEEPATQIAMRLALELQADGADVEDFTSLADVAEEVVNDLMNPLPCSSTGEPELDAMLGGGFYAGKLYAVMADHKAGKTMLLGTLSYNQHTAPEPVPHLYQCLEMSPKEITQRYLGRWMRVNALQFLNPETRDKQWFTQKAGDAAVAMRRGKEGLIFMSKPRAHLDDIKSSIVRAVMRHRIKGVYLDYLQLVTGQQDGKTMADHLDHIGATMAELCKLLNVWIVVNVQTNRTGLVRGGDGIMKAADMVLNLHRMAGADGKKSNFGWLDMEASRYTPYSALGSEDIPGLEMNAKHGPYFEVLREAPPVRGALAHEARNPSGT